MFALALELRDRGHGVIINCWNGRGDHCERQWHMNCVR
jgi:hypothetical protein